MVWKHHRNLLLTLLESGKYRHKVAIELVSGEGPCLKDGPFYVSSLDSQARGLPPVSLRRSPKEWGHGVIG